MHQVKDPVLSVQQLELLLQHDRIPGPAQWVKLPGCDLVAAAAQLRFLAQDLSYAMGAANGGGEKE